MNQERKKEVKSLEQISGTQSNAGGKEDDQRCRVGSQELVCSPEHTGAAGAGEQRDWSEPEN